MVSTFLAFLGGAEALLFPASSPVQRVRPQPRFSPAHPSTSAALSPVPPEVHRRNPRRASRGTLPIQIQEAFEVPIVLPVEEEPIPEDEDEAAELVRLRREVVVLRQGRANDRVTIAAQRDALDKVIAELATYEEAFDGARGQIARVAAVDQSVQRKYPFPRLLLLLVCALTFFFFLFFYLGSRRAVVACAGTLAAEVGEQPRKRRRADEEADP